MNSLNIHIDELLPAQTMQELREQLLSDPHIHHVSLHRGVPHDLLVECDDHQNMPMHILQQLKQRGLHADIVGC